MCLVWLISRVTQAFDSLSAYSARDAIYARAPKLLVASGGFFGVSLSYSPIQDFSMNVVNNIFIVFLFNGNHQCT